MRDGGENYENQIRDLAKLFNLGQCTSGSVRHHGNNHNNAAHTPMGEMPDEVCPF